MRIEAAAHRWFRRIAIKANTYLIFPKFSNVVDLTVVRRAMGAAPEVTAVCESPTRARSESGRVKLIEAIGQVVEFERKGLHRVVPHLPRTTLLTLRY